MFKKPAGAGTKKNAVVSSALLGAIKIMLCTHKSYVLRFDAGSKKWPLVVESHHENHQAIIQYIFEHAQSHSCSKADLVALRDDLQTRKTLPSLAGAAAASAASADLQLAD